jgi:hypothetical protein
MSDGPQFDQPIQTQAQWTWSTPVAGVAPTVVAYPTTNGPTKSGLMPADLRAFVQIPIQQFGNPPVPVPDNIVTQWIRWAEDEIEVDDRNPVVEPWDGWQLSAAWHRLRLR